jgi:hypothetical protein
MAKKNDTNKQRQIDSLKYLMSDIRKRTALINEVRQKETGRVNMFSAGCVDMVNLDAMGKRLTTDDAQRLNLCMASIQQSLVAACKMLALRVNSASDTNAES